jgi:hypothetical protein
MFADYENNVRNQNIPKMAHASGNYWSWDSVVSIATSYGLDNQV